MRIDELARTSGLSETTIKYYVRVGLLPAGERQGYNRVAYSEEHLHRLRLVRALLETGGLSVSAAGDVVGAVDDDALDVHSMLGVAQRALSPVDVEAALELCSAAGHADVADLLDDYRAAAARLAEVEVAWVARAEGRLTRAERAVVGIVLGDLLLTAARREAQVAASARTFRPY